MGYSRSVFSQARFTAVAVLVLFVGQLSAAFGLSAGTAQIGITKVATLQVATMETDQFYTNNVNDQMVSIACLQTGGEPVPYRVSASSLMGKGYFQVSSDSRQSQIGYNVVWSGKNENYTLNNSNDMTAVMQAEANQGCDNGRLSIEMDDTTYATASNGAYTDTLSLIFVIE